MPINGRQSLCVILLVAGAALPAQADPQYVALARQIAIEARVDPDLVVAVMAAESGFNAYAISPRNAKGLMQLTAGTARRFGVRDVFDPAENLRGGARYLRWLIDYFGGDLALVLAGYNAGEEAVRRHGGVPPYDETRNYLIRVRQRLDGVGDFSVPNPTNEPAPPPFAVPAHPAHGPLGANSRALTGPRRG